MKVLVFLSVISLLVPVLSFTPLPGAVNIARTGEATQSSVITLTVMCYPWKAIDGIVGGNVDSGACSHTQLNFEPWWRLDLNYFYKISSVFICGRPQASQSRLLGAEVRIGNSPDNMNPVERIVTLTYGNSQGQLSRCGTLTDVSTVNITLQCNGMVGRYVSVVIPGRSEYLTLCEVEVFGERVWCL